MHSRASDGWVDRYSRQTRFAPIGQPGQRRLGESRALIVGCGALGASLAQHMTRAGVGELRIADRDFVEPSNLQRQTLFHEADALAALPKAVAAAEKLRAINSEISIEAYVLDVNRQTVDPLIEGVDIVLDGTDNAATRLLLIDACYERGIPLVYGGVSGAQGMSAVLIPGDTACLRCVIGGEDEAGEGESCDTAGVLSAAVEWIASLQAIEAIKYLTGNREAVRGTWIAADLWRFGIREFRLPEGSPQCRHCGPKAGVGRDGRDDDSPSVLPPVALCGRDTVQVTLGSPLDLERIQKQFRTMGFELTVNRYLLKATLPQGEKLVLFPDGRVLVQGVNEPEKALRLCERYLLAESLK